MASASSSPLLRVRRIVRGACLALAVGAFVQASACGSDARSLDTCRKLESERCAKAAACPAEFPDFAATYGTVASCQQFYDVQCGRGVAEAVKEPSRAELASCLDAIKGSCEAARAPERFCPFLTANDPADASGPSTDAPVTDAGATDAATSEVASDAGAVDAPTGG